MTTTTTSNLNLEKPDVGSEANNWGNILNSSLDDVDKAIAQRLVKGVGGASDVTLTLADSKFAVIEFTGTLSGNISVKTYANDAKPYIVFNNTSGSFSLTFKTNTGGGVVLIQGQKTIVYSDGTNMVSAVDTSQLSVSRTITLSGDITGSVATNFSTNPTITTSIGSGVIVNADVNASAAIDASKIADGTVSNAEFQRLDGVSSDIQTQLDGLRHNADDVKIKFGATDDLEIFHDSSGGGTQNVIQATNTSHSLRLKSDQILLQGASGSTLASFSNGGSATLSYSNTGRLSTTGTGVAVTGELTATGNITASGNVNGNGQNLTNLNASALASGTVPDARFPATLPAVNGSALTNINASNVSGSGANLTTLTAAYPVGSIYMNILPDNANTLLGFGTWVRFGEGRMLVSQDSGDSDFNTGQETGGAKTHTLSEAQLPEHKHFLFSNYSMNGNAFSDWARRFNVDTGNGKNDSAAVEYYQASGSDDFKYSMAFDRNNAEPTVYKSGKVGSGSSVNHMNPYIVVYMWKRTA